MKESIEGNLTLECLSDWGEDSICINGKSIDKWFLEFAGKYGSEKPSWDISRFNGKYRITIERIDK